jgi:HD-GYP domain-containing protein (c-di-GMP phosphodiesterase class II)
MILMSLEDVHPGMLVGVGLRSKQGVMLLGPGIALTSAYIGRLKELGYCALWIDDEDTRDIPYEDSLTESTRLATTSAIQDTFALTSREVEKLRHQSLEEIRTALDNRRFQQAFQDSAVLDRLTSQVDAVVGEILDRAVLTGLGSLRTHNSYTYQHCVDVSVTATMIGRLLRYDRETLKKLAVGCILHDIGVLFVDSTVVEKAGPLGADEYDRVKDHSVLGYLFIRDTIRLGVLPSHVAYQHHERQDGSGYPRGLTGTNRIVQGPEMHVPGRITPLGEIAAIADYHDALSSDRPWRPRLAPDQVWRMIRAAAGPGLNREIVDVFLSVLPPFPLGTQVAITAGSYAGATGVVARIDRDRMDRPVIRLLFDAGGERMTPVELDLRRDDSEIRGVVAVAAGAPAADGPGVPVVARMEEPY